MTLSSDSAEQLASNPDRNAWPFFLHLSLIVTGILVVLIATVSWVNKSAVREIMHHTANAEFDHLASDIDTEFSRRNELANNAVDEVFALHPDQARTFAERVSLVGPIARILGRAPETYGIVMGYENGDFFLVTPVFGVPDEEASPSGTRYVVVIADHSTPDGKTTKLFIDPALRVLASQNLPGMKIDARERPWYKAALGHVDLTMSPPFMINGSSILAIVMGRSAGKMVVGVTVTAEQIADSMSASIVAPGTAMSLILPDGRVLATSEAGVAPLQDLSAKPGIDAGSEPQPSVIAALLAAQPQQLFTELPAPVEFEHAGRQWIGAVDELGTFEGKPMRLATALPLSHFTADLEAMEHKTVWVGLGLMGGTIPLVALVAHFVTRPLRLLREKARRIEAFDFDTPIPVSSSISEVEALANALDKTSATIRRFKEIGLSMSVERDTPKLLRRILTEAVGICGAEGGILSLYDTATSRFHPQLSTWGGEVQSISEKVIGGIPLSESKETTQLAIKTGTMQSLVVDDQYPFLAMLKLDHAVGRNRKLAMAQQPLIGQSGEPIGLLSLLETLEDGEDVAEFGSSRRSLVEAFCGSAASAMENRQLFESQKALMNSLIKLVAGAIDAKSPYTAGHCQRVPVLTRLLTEAACAETDGPFAEFGLSATQWEAVDVASWLHDCGKVTTPEYVVDKATKLETIYDRIHEIRTRFEVLKRDAEVAYWRGIAQGGDADELAISRNQALRAIDDDFAFVASCNEGGEFMAPEKLARLRQIGALRWTRTLDDRLGVSRDERRRMDRSPRPVLPVEEKMLSDRVDHLIEHDAYYNSIIKDDRWDFKIRPKAYKFNRGELYSLSVTRGTLTEEERLLINDHIVQTIVMLSDLPFPPHLRAVPEIACGHHEKMDGTGYPLGLVRGEMSLVARIMAIADVFEALTAGDRPYKRAKTLSETFSIIAAMKRDHHLDPDLVDLFVRSGAWERYAEEFLDPSQIDEPDLDAVLAMKPAPKLTLVSEAVGS